MGSVGLIDVDASYFGEDKGEKGKRRGISSPLLIMLHSPNPTGLILWSLIYLSLPQLFFAHQAHSLP